MQPLQLQLRTIPAFPGLATQTSIIPWSAPVAATATPTLMPHPAFAPSRRDSWQPPPASSPSRHPALCSSAGQACSADHQHQAQASNSSLEVSPGSVARAPLPPELMLSTFGIP